ncbi:MAG TPA: hypothetical protein PKK10_05395 [Woeseiaceae bacterium]|nr:hypothetical protein [Woeseiaceae bacterium]
MNEILLFTAVAIAIYLFSDLLVRTIEARQGKVLQQRQLVFFAIFLVLVLLTFRILRQLLQP